MQWRAVLLLPASMLLFAGCGHPQPRLQVLACPVPATELDCKAAPKTPSTGTDLDAADYIIELRLAGADCRARLETVKEILDGCRRKPR
jgi:hypothetical protein